LKTENKTVQFAVLVPKAMTNLDPPSSKDNLTRSSARYSEARPSDQSLNFDLATLSELAWFTVEVIGPAAQAVAYGIIANYLYTKLKSVKGDSEVFKLDVKFPNGRRLRFSSDNEEDIKELQKELEDQER